MLLYTKQSFRASPRQLARSLRNRIAEQLLPDLTEARQWLIALGQIEQAVLDAGLSNGGQASSATAAAANVFLEVRSGSRGNTKAAVTQLMEKLRVLELALVEQELEFRVPEGFAWYALYPDSYAQTAERWSLQFEPPEIDVCVIGLRSIGTTLAAVVTQALRRRGFRIASCLTLRPSGTWPSRYVDLQGLLPASQNIIVDEGPGVSGASMVAVAQALRDAGARRESIHFFAGHAYGPGPAAGADAKTWWQEDRVWTTSLDDTFVDGKFLPHALASAVEDYTGEPAVGPAEPLGTQGWQTLAGLRTLPRAIAPIIETPKKLVHLRSGRNVVLKFAGMDLSSQEHWRSGPNTALVTDRAAISPLGCHQGWLAYPWISGEHLSAADADTSFITEYLGPWLAAVSTRKLSHGEIHDGIRRIADALSAWAMMQEGGPPVSAIERVTEQVLDEVGAAPQPCYGDGRLAPHEWIRQSNGVIRKVDLGGHDRDHTWVGPQSVIWDLVGAEVEWDLDPTRAAELRSRVQSLTGCACSERSLAFYTAGYCAFRAAAAHFSTTTTNDAEFRAHLLEAKRYYEQRLEMNLAFLTTYVRTV